MAIFDRDLYVKRWHMCPYRPSTNQALDCLMGHMEKAIIERLGFIKTPFHRVCIHSPVPLPKLAHYLLERNENIHVVQLTNVEEDVCLVHTFDLMIVVNQWQWVNNVPKALLHYHNSLKHGGALLSVFVGEDSLWQLRHALNQADIECHGGVSPRVSPFLTLQTTAQLLQQTNFMEPVCDKESLTICHSSVFGLVNDIRQCYGRNSLKKRTLRPLSKAFLNALIKHYPKAQNGIETTLDLVYALAWKGGGT
jgi:hypothetical protein